MTDRDELAQLASNLGLLIDARDWDAAEALFCAQVELDYTSLNGGEPQRLSPAEIVGAWKENLSPLQATHHLIANHVVVIDGDDATVAANAPAHTSEPGRPATCCGRSADATTCAYGANLRAGESPRSR